MRARGEGTSIDRRACVGVLCVRACLRREREMDVERGVEGGQCPSAMYSPLPSFLLSPPPRGSSPPPAKKERNRPPVPATASSHFPCSRMRIHCQGPPRLCQRAAYRLQHLGRRSLVLAVQCAWLRWVEEVSVMLPMMVPSGRHHGPRAAWSSARTDTAPVQAEQYVLDGP